MWNNVENPMVIDRYWADKEREPKVVGYCEGCEEEIHEGQDILDLSTGLLHSNPECCWQYVAALAVQKVAGEE